MTYYWPIDDSYSEWIDDVDVESHGDLDFVRNRFYDKDSALKLDNSYISLDNGIYVSGDFSISAWVNIVNITRNARIFDCGNTGTYDNIALSYSDEMTAQPSMTLYNHSSFLKVVSPIVIPIGQWTHLVASLNGHSLRIYVNGSLAIEQDVAGFEPRSVNRYDCFIGNSILANVDLPKVILDQIKIYSRGLTENDVYNQLNGPAI